MKAVTQNCQMLLLENGWNLYTKYNPHISWLRKEIESAYDIKGYSYELTKNEVTETLGYLKTLLTYIQKLYRRLK